MHIYSIHMQNNQNVFLDFFYDLIIRLENESFVKDISNK